MKSTVQGRTLTKIQRPNYKIIEHCPPSICHHRITKNLFTVVTLNSTLCPTFKKKTKQKKYKLKQKVKQTKTEDTYTLETEKVSEQRTAGIVEFSD